MARRRMFGRKSYSVIGGVVTLTVATLVGFIAGEAFAYAVVPSGLTPEEFGERAAPYALLGITSGLCTGALVEYTRWHYSRR